MAWLIYLVLAVVAARVAYEGWRYFRRRKVVRITPEQLKERLELGDPLVLADLRPWQQVMQSGETLPRARVTSGNDLLRDLRAGKLSGELILYCT